MARPKRGESDDKRMQFGMWIGVPLSARRDDEKTREQFAKKIGINSRTLTRWAREPSVQEIARNAIKFLGGDDKLDVVNAIIKEAKAGSPGMARLYMEWQGEIGARVEGKKMPGEFRVTFHTEQK